MANNIVQPRNLTVFDDKRGNTYLVFDVTRTSAEHDTDETMVIVPDSAVSAAELPSANAAPTISLVAGSDTGAATPSTDEMAIGNLTSGASGLGFTFTAGDGVKQLHIDNTVAAGTYKIVVRCIGSAGGTGSTNSADL